MCMNIGTADRMARGDTGLGICVEDPAEIDEVVMVKAVDHAKVEATDDNSWDDEESYVLKQDNVYEIAAVSLDMNENGRESELGLRQASV